MVGLPVNTSSGLDTFKQAGLQFWPDVKCNIDNQNRQEKNKYIMVVADIYSNILGQNNYKLYKTVEDFFFQ